MKWLLLIIASFFISTGSVDVNKKAFVIKPNESAQEILTTLQTSGLIKSVFFAKVYLKLSGQISNLKPGVYYLSPSQKFDEILNALSRGPDDVRVTILEGWRREQIAQYLSPYLSDKDFMVNSANLEGRLFPDTYYISSPSSSLKIIKFMTDNFNNNFKNGVNNEALIIASMIEREARVSQERGMVAGILWKRYKNGWPLQVDATVQYAVDSSKCRVLSLKCVWWQPITDTKFPSAYNTYTHSELPPGPIGNPGLDSIKAALEPVESPYWFYLHDNSGGIHYAKTIEEHNLNVDKYLNH